MKQRRFPMGIREDNPHDNNYARTTRAIGQPAVATGGGGMKKPPAGRPLTAEGYSENIGPSNPNANGFFPSPNSGDPVVNRYPDEDVKTKTPNQQRMF